MFNLNLMYEKVIVYFDEEEHVDCYSFMLLFLLGSCTIGYHEDESFEVGCEKCYTGISQLENVKSGT